MFYAKKITNGRTQFFKFEKQSERDQFVEICGQSQWSSHHNAYIEPFTASRAEKISSKDKDLAKAVRVSKKSSGHDTWFSELVLHYEKDSLVKVEGLILL